MQGRRGGKAAPHSVQCPSQRASQARRAGGRVPARSSPAPSTPAHLLHLLHHRLGVGAARPAGLQLQGQRRRQGCQEGARGGLEVRQHALQQVVDHASGAQGVVHLMERERKGGM